jgi:hypothetical protein
MYTRMSQLRARFEFFRIGVNNTPRHKSGVGGYSTSACGGTEEGEKNPRGQPFIEPRLNFS